MRESSNLEWVVLSSTFLIYEDQEVRIVKKEYKLIIENQKVKFWKVWVAKLWILNPESNLADIALS